MAPRTCNPCKCTPDVDPSASLVNLACAFITEMGKWLFSMSKHCMRCPMLELGGAMSDHAKIGLGPTYTVYTIQSTCATYTTHTQCIHHIYPIYEKCHVYIYNIICPIYPYTIYAICTTYTIYGMYYTKYTTCTTYSMYGIYTCDVYDMYYP